MKPETLAFVIVGGFGLWLALMLFTTFKGLIRNYCEYRAKIKKVKEKAFK